MVKEVAETVNEKRPHAKVVIELPPELVQVKKSTDRHSKG